MAKKKHDPQAKAKRQKVIVAVGGVILLGLLAFQLPRTLKLLHPSSATASSSAPAAAPATPGVVPSAGVSVTGTAAATSADGITDPGSAVTPQSGQLLAFSRFHTKDPFSQQVNLDCAAGQSASADCSTGSGTVTGPGSGGTGSSGSGPGGGTGSTGTGSIGPGGVAQPPVKPTTALISVNGANETVNVGSQFPAASPVFVLVSLTRTSARIGIADGSLQGGGTATLKKGKTLTLMNTSDGTKYVLRLVSVA